MTTHVGLRFKHPSLDLAKVAAGLGLPVAQLWTAGEPRRTRQGEALKGIYPDSYLALKVRSGAGTIAGAIQEVRAAFDAAPAEVTALLGDPQLRRSLYCTLESRGEEIDVAALQVLVNLGIELQIEGVPSGRRGSNQS